MFLTDVDKLRKKSYDFYIFDLRERTQKHFLVCTRVSFESELYENSDNFLKFKKKLQLIIQLFAQTRLKI